jgi:2-dehydropantoate 2-reductase
MSGLRIAVFGAGAVGGYFGGRLAEAGEDVYFVARGSHLAALRADGLRVTSIAGDFAIRPVQVTDDPSELGRADVVLVGVKAWQLPEAADAIRPLVGDQTCILPLQNGIEAPDQLARVHGSGRVLGGLCRIIAYVDGPGHIRHAGAPPYVAFGELEGRNGARVEALRLAFARTRGITVEIPDDIRAAMWSKFVFIAALSGVGALVRAPIGVIRGQPETRALLQEALQEIYAVAGGFGVTLAPDLVATTLAYIDTMPADGTASMQRDVIQGRPSELEAQVGAVVRLGERAGVPVPLHHTIYAALLPLERKARGALEFSL